MFFGSSAQCGVPGNPDYGGSTAWLCSIFCLGIGQKQDKLHPSTAVGKVLLILDCRYAGNMCRVSYMIYLRSLPKRCYA